MSRGDAVFSDDGQYRYLLTRAWGGQTFGGGPEGQGSRQITWVMLNPSTADALEDDATIRRCTRFSAVWNFTRMNVVNLYAYRATDPRRLLEVDDPWGPRNYAYVSRAIRDSVVVVAAWGAFADKMPGRIDIEGICSTWDVSLKCLGLTKDGHPKHPLYLPTKTALMDFGLEESVA